MKNLTKILLGLLLHASAAFAGIGSPPYNPAAVAITGGAITGVAISGTTGQIVTAQTTANTAQTTANTAQTAANTAQTAANTAQTAANTAQADATSALAGGHYGQTWQDVTGSRVTDGTVYTNSTGKTIVVNYYASGSGGNTTYTGHVGALQVAYIGFAAGSMGGMITMTVPVGATYKITKGGAADSARGWAELR